MRLSAIIIMVVTWSCTASATTYYVSSSSGNDANGGTSASTPWETIAHVNGQTFLPGDSILFRRGDVWNESLAPPSSGSSGNPITFDAYGTGTAPNLTGYYAVQPSAWVLVTGNAWKAPLPATYSTVNFCLFGSTWGQKVAAVTSNLTAQGNFYLANGFLYIYSVGNPGILYNEPIVPMGLSNVPVINVNGQSWLTFQHFLVNWFDEYGVYVQGNSDHLVLANMEADSMIPQGTQPLGFYVNESAPGPGDIKIYNAEAHLNYDGFRFDGSATAITMVNDKAYGNRDGALVDNTSGVTYAYCHFYGSSLAVAGSTDLEWTSGTGPIAGAGNISQDTAPAVQVWQRYPAEVTLTVDDAGMTTGADTYYSNTVLPIADAASVPVGVAVTVGYPLAQTLVSEFQGWVNAGRDVTSHSMSHTYYTNTDALEIQYTGSGTAATLSVSGQIVTIAVTGASDSVSYNLAQGQTEGTIKGLRQALAATGKFTATEIQTCQGPYGTGCSAYTEAALLSQDLAEVSGQDVRTAVYHMQLDVTRLTTDEITLSRQWMTTNLTGLPATPVFVYPGGYETTTMQGITAGVPYSGARGALKEDLGVKDTYASGFDVQNITSFGVNPSWQGLQAASLNQKIQALVWKQRVWGVPWGIFWHLNELSATEITNLIQDFKTSGATIQTNTGLVNWLRAGTQEAGTDGNAYYVVPATSTTLDLRPTKNSPVVDAGQNLGTTYALDINGVNQNSYGSGWEIGSHVYQGYSEYGTGQVGTYFKIGLGTSCGPPLYPCSRTDLNVDQIVSIPNLGGLVGANTLVTPADFGNPVVRITDANTDSAFANITYVASCGGAQGAQTWNTNSTLLMVCNTNTRTWPMTFNASTLQAAKLYVGAGGFPNGFFIPGNITWSRANPYLAYILSGTVITGYCFADMVSGNCPSGGPLDIVNPPTVANGRVFTVVDFTSSQNGLGTHFFPSGFTPDWTEFGGPSVNDASFAVGFSYDIAGTLSATNGSNTVSYVSGTQFDTRYQLNSTASAVIGGTGYQISGFTGCTGATCTGMTLASNYAGTSGNVAFTLKGFQGSGVNALVYVPGSGIAMVNTETGVFTSDFNGSCNFTTPCTLGISDRWTMHDVFSTAGPTYSMLGFTTCLSVSCPGSHSIPYLWTVNTTTFVACSTGCGGHFTEEAGYSHITDNPGSPNHDSFDIIPFSNYATGNTLIPTTPSSGLTAPWDQHPSWNNVDPLDSFPIVTSSYLGAGAGTIPTSFPAALYYEIFAVNPVSGTITRFAHDYITGQASAFGTSQGIGQVSQDGRFFMFSSDWMGTLGSSSGASTCTVGTDCRGDVFVVQLR